MAGRRHTPVNLGCAEPHACSPALRRRALAGAPMFRALDDAALADVDARCTAVGVAAGEVVHRAGDPADWLLVVATGRVKLTRPAVDGTEVLVDLARPGDVVGMLTQLGESAYPETATALTTTCLLRFGAEDFREVLRRHPEVALAALDATAARLTEARAALRAVAAGTSEQRVAATLVRLADRVGVPRREGLLLDVPLTRADLAAMAGTTTETVSRVLSRWRADGLITSGRAWVALVDREAIAGLAG
jgi:CRP-like cAMP-binding protein